MNVQWKFIGPYLPIGRYGPFPERVREQFEGVFWPYRWRAHRPRRTAPRSSQLSGSLTEHRQVSRAHPAWAP